MTKRGPRTRPRYEDYGVSRAVVEEHWDQWVAWGEIGSAEVEAEMLSRACEEMSFHHTPKDGWSYVARELRIIHFQLPEARTEDSLSRAQMAKRCSACADEIIKIGREMNDMAWQEDYTMAALEAKSGSPESEMFEYCNLPGRIFELVGPMRKFAYWLELSSNWQPRKARPSSDRERRLVLACKLLPIFEDQFGLEPKLKGGSASLPIEDESPWAQFFRQLLHLLWGSKARRIGKASSAE
ncbi:hypothetical protein QQS45_06335 [Alteriqipengyuania flavescens]|uniref:hypothetical protein n=1 Tax=Alteriqipengyuania flavescens TaxID=3053610 RepID=UPI0025B2E209|nr:hypothetical protein [Alteriqipengyuania flavescens]WJY19827.1 hypothetical protein QQW98_06330 [Alteriqipengyuania flavescens]WJY25769.1 hypothetical protein QQS45_06335 [Alteriqipengyuania flavescens]